MPGVIIAAITANAKHAIGIFRIKSEICGATSIPANHGALPVITTIDATIDTTNVSAHYKHIGISLAPTDAAHPLSTLTTRVKTSLTRLRGRDWLRFPEVLSKVSCGSLDRTRHPRNT